MNGMRNLHFSHDPTCTMRTLYAPAATQWVICLLKANCQIPREGGGRRFELSCNGQSPKYILHYRADNVRFQSLYYVNYVSRHQHDKNQEQLFRP